MELFKRENGTSLQIFKIYEKIQPNEGEFLYSYNSIIVNPLELKQMDDFLTEEDYNYIKKNYVEIQNDDLEDILSKRIAVSNKGKFYNECFETFINYFKNKAEAQKEAKKIHEEKGGDFYEILTHLWNEKGLYDLRSEVLSLRGVYKISGNLLQQYICDKAFIDATKKYLIRDL